MFSAVFVIFLAIFGSSSAQVTDAHRVASLRVLHSRVNTFAIILSKVYGGFNALNTRPEYTDYTALETNQILLDALARITHNLTFPNIQQPAPTWEAILFQWTTLAVNLIQYCNTAAAEYVQNAAAEGFDVSGDVNARFLTCFLDWVRIRFGTKTSMYIFPHEIFDGDRLTFYPIPRALIDTQLQNREVKKYVDWSMKEMQPWREKMESREKILEPFFFLKVTSEPSQEDRFPFQYLKIQRFKHTKKLMENINADTNIISEQKSNRCPIYTLLDTMVNAYGGEQERAAFRQLYGPPPQ